MLDASPPSASCCFLVRMSDVRVLFSRLDSPHLKPRSLVFLIIGCARVFIKCQGGR